MTESIPPRMQGQIHSPNPVELFWEKHRRVVITIVAAVVFALGLNYVLQYIEQREIDDKWGLFAAATNLDLQYASPETLPFRQPDFASFIDGLITQLDKHVGAVDRAALTAAMGEAVGTPAEPLLIWVAAQRAIENREWDEAEGFLNDLRRDFPLHPLCISSEYPVQYRKSVEEEEPDPPDPNHVHELEPPVPGSAVAAVLAQIQGQREFTREQSRFYEPIEPTEGAPRIRVTTSQGAFVVALYKERATKHVDHLLQLVADQFYDNQNVDQIVREGTGPAFQPPADEFHFGLENSKNQDRTLWTSTEPSEQIFDFEEGPGQRELSHFPGTMSAAAEAEGKSSGERYWINVTDAASLHDGERVIVGRVVEGMDVLEIIVSRPFATDAEVQMGRGRPRENIRIEKIEML